MAIAKIDGQTTIVDVPGSAGPAASTALDPRRSYTIGHDNASATDPIWLSQNYLASDLKWSEANFGDKKVLTAPTPTGAEGLNQFVVLGNRPITVGPHVTEIKYINGAAGTAKMTIAPSEDLYDFNN